MRFLFFCASTVCLVLLITSMILFITGCDDNDHEKHTDSDGFVLEDKSGSQVYREFKGDTEGTITLSIGDTLELSVYFLDHKENEIEHEDDEEDEDQLLIFDNDASIAFVEPVEHEEGDEGHHEMEIHVIGVGAGSTSFKLELRHDGHADYTSTNTVPITVN